MIFLLRGAQVSKQRTDSLTVGTVTAYRDMLRPHLRRHQEKYGKKTLDDVGNFDEFCVDLCAYASGVYICVDDGTSANVITLHERSPHITVLGGFRGRKFLRLIVLVKGVHGYLPHEYNLELTAGSTPKISLAQQESAYMNDAIKAEAIGLWIADGDLRRGDIMNEDGHGSNLQRDLGKKFDECGVLNSATPAHCTAEALQQADRRNGFIQRIKKRFILLYRAAVRASLKKKKDDPTCGKIKLSLILALLQKAARLETESDEKKELFIRDNRRVGYFINDEGYLDYDPMRVLDASRFTTEDATAEVAVLSARQAEVDAAKRACRRDMEAAGYVWDHKDDVGIEEPSLTIPRGGHGRKSENQYGVITSSPGFYARRVHEDQRATEAANKKNKKAEDFIAKWKRKCQELRFSGGDDGKPRLTPMKVEQLKTYIVGKSGKTAPWGKPRDQYLELARALQASSWVFSPLAAGLSTANHGDDNDDEEEEEEEETSEQDDDEGEDGELSDGDATAEDDAADVEMHPPSPPQAQRADRRRSSVRFATSPPHAESPVGFPGEGGILPQHVKRQRRGAAARIAPGAYAERIRKEN